VEKVMKKTLAKLGLIGLLVVGLAVTPALAVEKVIDCDKGQSIQDALDTMPAAFRDTYTISFSGTCTESISIRRSNITIDGNEGPTPPTLVGRLTILAPNVRIQFITITGPDQGVVISQGGSAVLSNVNIVNNGAEGLHIRRNGFALVIRSTISGNSSAGALLEGASLEVSRSDIVGNQGPGIIVDGGSDVIIRQSQLVGNGDGGIHAGFHSIATIKDSSQVYGNGGHGAFASQDSGIRVTTGDVYFPDDIFCDDDESSFSNYEGAETGPVYCTGFDQVVP